MEDEILDLDWFQHVPCRHLNVKNLFSVKRMRYSEHRGAAADTSEYHHGQLVCWASGSCCDDGLARLQLFWAEDRATLWSLIQIECGIQPVLQSNHFEACRVQGRIRKVAVLVRCGPKGRALAAAQNALHSVSLPKLLLKVKQCTSKTQAQLSDTHSMEYHSLSSRIKGVRRLSEPRPAGHESGAWV